MQSKKESGQQKLITIPELYSEIDLSSILSFSVNVTNSILITKDYQAMLYGNNSQYSMTTSLPQKKYEEFTKFDIIKDENNIYYPHSVYIGYYILFMATINIKKSSKNILIYSDFTRYQDNPHILNIGNSIPVAIFGGCHKSASINMDGSILYIPDSIKDNYDIILKPQHLPECEQAINLACGETFLYVLSSSGNLYYSKEVNKFNLVFKQVNKFKNTKIAQISGINEHFLALTEDGRVFSCGQNFYGELGFKSKKQYVNTFTEIFSLRKYEIKYVYAGRDLSFFQTKNGQILSCGDNSNNLCLVDNKIYGESIFEPVETSIKKDAKFCIPGINSTIVFIGCDAEMAANRRIKDDIDITIALFGCKSKTQILQIFVKNDQIEDEYDITIKFDLTEINFTLIDSSKYENDDDMIFKCYHRTKNFIYFIDVTDYTSINNFNKFYDEIKKIWFGLTRLVVVLCYGVFTSSENSEDQFSKLYPNIDFFQMSHSCKIFKIISKDDINIDDNCFYHFLPIEALKAKEIIKVGKEHENPFLNIQKNHINIGIFWSQNINEKDLGFRYIFGDFYQHYYKESHTNFIYHDLTKIIEISNKTLQLSIIDTSFVKNIEDEYYSLLNGFIFVFNFEIISKSNFIEEIKNIYNKAKKSIEGEFYCVIALKLSNSLNSLNKLQYQQITKISREFNCKVFTFSIETNENVEDIFYYLTKRILQRKNKDEKNGRKRKHKK